MILQTWLLYLAAVLVLTITPGPSVLMCVTNGIRYGARRTLASALGSITAVCLIMAISAFGLGAVLAKSEAIFAAIKWLGAAYLIFIGIKTFFSKQTGFTVEKTAPAASVRSLRSLYLNGFFVGAANPKALLFFTAFFPQFITPHAPALPQFLILGASFVCLELFCLMFYAVFAASIAPWLCTPGRALAFNRISGAAFVGAGTLLATAKRS